VSSRAKAIEAAGQSLATIGLSLEAAGPIDKVHLKTAAVDAYRLKHRMPCIKTPLQVDFLQGCPDPSPRGILDPGQRHVTPTIARRFLTGPVNTPALPSRRCPEPRLLLPRGSHAAWPRFR
jgi:hypothetical protein